MESEGCTFIGVMVPAALGRRTGHVAIVHAGGYHFTMTSIRKGQAGGVVSLRKRSEHHHVLAMRTTAATFNASLFADIANIGTAGKHYRLAGPIFQRLDAHCRTEQVCCQCCRYIGVPT
ncbi:unnamed protein product [Cercospora beticola]|nr:unnamed protein product [Cercospora beticola]